MIVRLQTIEKQVANGAPISRFASTESSMIAQHAAGEYEVDNNGFVSIPLAGHIRAGGLTTRQLERAIASALSKGIVRDPRVNVEVASYRNFYILGEVKKGGEYPYRLGLTVMDAVATAGGFTYRANENKAYLRRSGSPSEPAFFGGGPGWLRSRA